MNAHTHVHAHPCTRTQTRLHICTHTYINAHTNKHTHKRHTHLHTHIPRAKLVWTAFTFTQVNSVSHAPSASKTLSLTTPLPGVHERHHSWKPFTNNPHLTIMAAMETIDEAQPPRATNTVLGEPCFSLPLYPSFSFPPCALSLPVSLFLSLFLSIFLSLFTPFLGAWPINYIWSLVSLWYLTYIILRKTVCI